MTPHQISLRPRTESNALSGRRVVFFVVCACAWSSRVHLDRGGALRDGARHVAGVAG